MNAAAIYNGLEFSTRKINMNFRIKVSGIDNNRKKINKLVGVSGLILLIGVEFVNKFIAKAFKGKGDKTECKLRRGIKVTFYIK